MISQPRIRSGRVMQQDLTPRGAMPLELPTSRLDDILLFEQGGVIAPTPLLLPITSDLFEVSVYVVCTQAGTGALDFVLSWNDGYAVQSESIITGVNLTGVGNYASVKKVIRALQDAIVTYEVVVPGLGAGAEYALFIKADKL